MDERANDILLRIEKQASKDKEKLDSLVVNQNNIEPNYSKTLQEDEENYWKKVRSHKLHELEDTHTLRKKFSLRMFCLTCSWLLVIILILIADGLSKLDDFSLPSSVLIALITSTTAAVLALFIRGNKWLEPPLSDKTRK